jgi:Peptidase family M28
MTNPGCRDRLHRSAAQRSWALRMSVLLAAAAIALPTYAAKPRQKDAATADPVQQIVRGIDAKNIERTIRTLVSFGTRSTLSSQDDPKRGIGVARDWLYGQLQGIAKTSDGRMTVELQSYEQDPGRYARVATLTRITNVVATLRGSDPDSAKRVYVVSGHYDSMCTSPTDAQCDAPGADDDASGVAAVLEAARVMARHRFNATIVFMAVAGEEQGLIGSTYYAEQAKKNGMDIDAMFTNDIVGNTLGGNGTRDRRTVRVFSEGVQSNGRDENEARASAATGDENDSASRQLARYIVEVTHEYLPDFRVWMIYRRDRYLRSGDHVPFLQQGYPAVRFTEPNENYNHQHQNVRMENGVQYGDLPEFTDVPYIARVARVNAAALASLALAPARPREARILTTRLTNDTDLQWAPDSEPYFDHYEIVWRGTTDVTWTHSKPIGRETTYTAPGISKDNYIFGVRAVGRDGHKSPASFPIPLRNRPPAKPAQ